MVRWRDIRAFMNNVYTASFGVSGAAVVSADMSGGADVTDAPATGKKLVITDIVVATDTALSFLFEEETSGTDIVKFFCAANSSAQIRLRGRVKLATADKKLRCVTSASGNVSVTVVYYSET